MIDTNAANPRPAKSTTPEALLQSAAQLGPAPSANLFNDIFGLHGNDAPLGWNGSMPESRPSLGAVPAPLSPSTLTESGLTLTQMSDLILKLL
ncbi:MAG: hypothetical protein WD648_08340, partial [Planctomycetaceae bacterium]